VIDGESDWKGAFHEEICAKNKPGTVSAPRVQDRIMSFIKVIAEEEASGELKDVYEQTLARLSPSVRQRRGNKLPPIVKIFSLCPELLEARVGFDKGIYRPGHSGLGRRKEELIATQVAALSGCRF
jgi:hypothetical protein